MRRKILTGGMGHRVRLRKAYPNKLCCKLAEAPPLPLRTILGLVPRPPLLNLRKSRQRPLVSR